MITKLLFRIAFIFPFVLNAQICNNINFESGNFSGWTIKSGTTQVLQSNQTMTTCCGTAGSPEAIIMTTPFAEPYAGYLPHSPLGGTKVARLNDSDATTINLGLITRISYPIAVTPSTNLQYAISGYVTGLTHPCDDYAYANVRLKDGSGTVFYVNQLMDYSGSTACGNSAAFTNTITSHGLAYFCWQTYSVNLTPYIGQNITLEVTAGDCTGWGHAGYCYFDATCSIVTPTMLPCGLTTGIENNFSSAEINIGPNPFSEAFNISISEVNNHNYELEIYDITGKIVFTKKDLQKSNHISLHNLNRGMYFYKIVDNNQPVRTGKLIKE
jgi:hypothetical protein